MGEILKAAGCDYSNGEISLLSGFSHFCLSAAAHVSCAKNKLSDRVNFSISVVKTTVLLADINDFNSVNEVYKTCKSMLCFSFPNLNALNNKSVDVLYFSYCQQKTRVKPAILPSIACVADR